ncbi:MAG: gamma-glutamyltransferase [bacterium]|nr:gamma-glutamyltransferase [bacterium]
MKTRRASTFLIAAALFAALTGCAPGPVAKLPVEAPPPAPPDTFFARAIPAVAAKGMVVSAHPLASEAGLQVLRSGGNAIDATVATLAVLNVVEPHASGLGGGGFLLYYDAVHDSFLVLDYRESAPARLEKAKYFRPTDTLHAVQRSGATSVLTLGSPAGWQAMHSRFGTKLLKDLLEPAILLADSGYPVSEKQSAMILDYLADLQSDSNLARVFLSDGLPLQPGQMLRQPRLAETLRFLSRTRLENLYYPPLSDAIVRAVQKGGGDLTVSDLASYSVKERKPLRATYHGYEIITLPPPSSGGTILLETLRLLEAVDLKAMGHLSPDYIHTVALASRQALKDAEIWITDPDFNRVPGEALLSDAWIEEARARMLTDTVPDRMPPMDSLRAFGPGNTTHLVAVDSAGNLVSLTQSLNYFFGSGVMVPELGLLLNNHMADFSTDSTGAKAMAPLHRPPSNMAATIVRKDGRPVLVIGTPGGPRIAPTLAQVLIDVLDFGLPLHEALNAPRFFPAGKKTLVVETRIPQSTLDALSAKGWKPYPLGSVNNYFGGVNAIEYDSAARVWIGAADPRRAGVPAGF